jgi:hypothetical protein
MSENSKELTVTSTQIEGLSDALLLFSSILGNDLAKYKQSKIYKFPFHVTNEILNQIQEEAIIKIRDLYRNAKINFEATVSFQDLMTINYDTLDDFLKKSARKKDPKEASLSWSTFSLQKNRTTVGYITIDFITEKKLTTSIWQPGDFLSAYVQLTVAGAQSEWVENTFSDIEPLIDLCKLDGLYRPLWIFRSKFFTQFCSFFVALFSSLFIPGFLREILTLGERFKLLSNRYERELKTLQDIEIENEIGNKIDILAKYIINPLSPSDYSTTNWGQSILIALGYVTTYILVYLIVLELLPKLAPSSHLAIGLNTIRVERYFNMFRFIVFDLICLAFLSPFIVAIIRYIMFRLQ